MIPNLGPWEILLILLVVLLVFGAKRLPEMGAAMGKGIKEFKRNISEMKDSIDKGETSADVPPRQLDAASSKDAGEPKKLSE
jgi:sec-independent protein translocase protein TatA